MPNRDTIIKALAGTPVTIFFQNADGTFKWFVNPQSVWAEADFTGTDEREIFESEDLLKIRAAREDTSQTEKPSTADAVARILDENGRQRHWSLRLTYNKTRDHVSGEEGYICSCIDITEQVQREQTLKNLLREVAHRSKNMLAMVLSLSSQTARAASSKEEFVRRFTGRLQSLAKSQDVITDRDWRGSTLSELVQRQVHNVIPIVDGQVLLEGDDVELGPNATVHVGLALHELITNAMLHGALTIPKGKIVIDCKAGRAGEPTKITWRETPHLRQEARPEKSFGQTMLERIVPAAVNGTGTLDLSGDCVTYTLTVAQSELR